ncbi:MAG: nickel pincer cofactor biosynthesis protein LarB [Phycisphaerae bacterium]
MNADQLRTLLAAVQRGQTSVDEATERLGRLPVESLGFANVDHHRALRCGFPEVIYCPGKTTEQIVDVFDALASRGGQVLATRAEKAQYDAIAARHPSAEFHDLARCVTLRQQPAKPSTGMIAIVAAGTSDLPIAEESRTTAELMDQRTESFYDVGVAGIHRLLQHEAALRRARVVIVVAGMEGALLSVIGGFVEAPCIGVPTSVGYGANLAGLAPMFTMLNSCAAGSAVVNIDNGFGAGYVAAIINRIGEPSRRDETAEGAS